MRDAKGLRRRPVQPRRALLLLTALLPLGLLGGGCIAYGPPEASSVARGEYFSTGNPDYDEFFVRLFRLQVALGSAPASLARARASLARRLGLTEDAEITELRSALVQRAGELRGRGFVLRVEASRDAQPGATLETSGTPEPKDAELVRDLESAFAVTSEVRAGLPRWRRELAELPPRGVALESGLEAAFVGTGRGERTDIRTNLGDAQKIMGLMGPRLEALDRASSELHAAFTAAFSPPAPAPAPAPPPPEAAEEPKTKRRSGRPAGPKPAPKSASSDTGDAPRPPKQGTAKPDFEP